MPKQIVDNNRYNVVVAIDAYVDVAYNSVAIIVTAISMTTAVAVSVSMVMVCPANTVALVFETKMLPAAVLTLVHVAWTHRASLRVRAH